MSIVLLVILSARKVFLSGAPSERLSVLCEGHYGYKHSTLGLEKKKPFQNYGSGRA